MSGVAQAAKEKRFYFGATCKTLRGKSIAAHGFYKWLFGNKCIGYIANKCLAAACLWKTKNNLYLDTNVEGEGVRMMIWSMNKRMVVALMGASWLLFAGTAVAAELKIGYVDMKSAVENTADYQQGMQRLQALQNSKVKELRSLKEKINQGEKDLLGQSMAMSPDRLAQKQRELKEMGKNFQRKQQDAQEELGAEKNRLDIGIGAKFQKVITTYGKKGHYDMIMPRPVFLYVDPKLDVTGAITKLLDAKK
ncbi:MAG: OmpH family outer membrane protein [Mariprofundus sp.]|nr:OmpH family outer membrane protein [Mariprofundus sp.]